jgi:hypothetical protein
VSDPVLELSFAAGLDEGTRDELVEPGKGWPVLENVRQERYGAVNKRLGFAELTTDRLGTGIADRVAGNRTFGHGARACVVDGTFLDTYDETFTVNTIQGRVPELAVNRLPVASFGDPAGSSTGPDAIDLAYANGHYVVACNEQSSGTAWYMAIYVISRATRTTVRVFKVTPSETGARKMKLCSVGSKVYLVYAASSSSLEVKYLDLTSVATLESGFSSATTVASDWNGQDFDIVGMATGWAVAYSNNSGGAASLTVKNYAHVTASHTNSSVNTFGTVNAVAIDGSESDVLWVAWGRAADSVVKVIGLNPANCSTVTATSATVIFCDSLSPSRLGIRRVTSTTGIVVCRDPDTTVTSWYRLRANSFSVSAGAVSVSGATSVSGLGWTPYSQPFVINGRVYCCAAYSADDNPPGNLVAVDISASLVAMRPVANPARGLNLYQIDATRAARHVVAIASGIYATVSLVQRSSTDAALEVFEFDATARHRWQYAQHNGSAYLSGGVVACFDGQHVFESGFIQPPSIRASASGSSGIAGTYDYTAVYEWEDADGNVHISEPAFVKSVTTSSNGADDQQIDLYVLPCSVTWRDGLDDTTGVAPQDTKRIRAKVYRTPNGVSAPFYLLTTLLSVPGDTPISFTDTTSDASLIRGAQLYTQPGESNTALSRRSPPATVALASCQGCLIAIADDRRTVWMTGEPVSGEGAWWNDVFQAPVGDEDLIALAVQDGTVYIFGSRSIYAMAIEPPNDNGTTGGLGEPRKLAADVGCIEPNSIVVTSAGVFFQSHRGIELLDRGGSVSFIGAQVQETMAAYPVVAAAVLDDRNGLVRFSLAEGESGSRVTGNGRDLVFDLTIGQWQSVDDKTGSTAHEASQSAAMITIAGVSRYAWLGTDGVVHYERDEDDGSACLDGSYWVTKRAVTPWVAIAGRNGEQFIDQVLLLAKRVTDHDLTVSVAFDYSDSYTTSKPFTAAQVSALAREWLVAEILQTTSQAVRIKIEDATPSSGIVGTGEGASWVALTLNGQPHRGPKRSSGAQRGGS